MSDLAPVPDFEPAQPLRPETCGICRNAHDTKLHPVLEVLNRQTEMLAIIAGILEPKRYRLESFATADANSRGTVVFEHVPGGVNNLWLVERISIQTNSTGTPSAAMYVLDALPQGTAAFPNLAAQVPNGLAWSAPPAFNGTGSVSDPAPALVKGGEKIVFQWATLSAAAQVSAKIQIRQAWQAVD